jgi:type II secretory pathway component GspD/PulD (secretin)
MRDLHAKILNQQTLWTKDNEEAQFFKGQRVGFQTQISISDTGGRATSNFEYEKVGMTLRARPSITPEKNVDMIINIILSQLESEVINTQPVRTELDTTTNLVVKDGQTIMLGGMLFQEDSRTNRKVPFLGDLPLLGGLFRHKQDVQANSELLIFITPYVIETAEQMLPEARQEQEQARRKLGSVQNELKVLVGPNDEPPADGDSPEPATGVGTPKEAPAADDRTKETK